MASTRGASGDQAALEARLADDPSDDEAWAQYRTALEAEGDPRAELMAVDLELEADGPSEERLARRREVFDRHRGALLGPFADLDQDVELVFARGHVVSARVKMGASPPADRIGPLLALPVARLLRELAIEASGTAALRAVGRARPIAVRRLEVGERPDRPMLANPGAVAYVLPRLRELVVVGTPRSLDTRSLGRLSRLELRSTHLPREILAELMRTEWPELEAMVLWLGETEALARELAPLLSGAIAPKLAEIGICNTTLTNHVCRALAKSPLAARLRRIDLSKGTMTDGGAAAIAAAAPALAQLESLDATENLLTELGEGYLRIAVAGARTEGQRAGYGEGVRVPALVSGGAPA